MKQSLKLYLLILPTVITAVPVKQKEKESRPKKLAVQEKRIASVSAIQGEESLHAIISQAGKQKKPLFIKAYLPGCAACIAVEKPFAAVAEKLTKKVLFASLNSSDKKNSKLVGQLGIGMMPAFIGIGKLETVTYQTNPAELISQSKNLTVRSSGTQSEHELEKRVKDLLAAKKKRGKNN